VKFAVDPWDPAYGASLEGEARQSEAKVIVDVVVGADAWAPIAPSSSAFAPDSIVFVDGVRRLDARAWIDLGDDLATAGIFASYAAGAVRCDGQARVVDIQVGRGVFAPVPAGKLADVPTVHGLYTAHQTTDATPASMMYAVHQRMSECEVRIAELVRGTGELLVLDGPLRHPHLLEAVGLVKSHDVHYLPPELDRVVARLAPGERTPVFRVDAQPFSRYSWYLRLPGPAGGPWAGIARCEATGALPVAEVRARAATVAVTLPRFASEPHKDTRAPQNLYPIAGLERELRRRLGDAGLLYRALRAVSVSAA